MLSVFVSACVLAALTMWLHAMGIAVLVRGMMRPNATLPVGVWPAARMLLRMIWWLILLHVAEISVWGLFYLWRGCLPDAEEAFYFSGVTYTTLGFGDVVLVKPWRLLAPVEGLMGVLMCGLSTGYFFVIVSRMYRAWPAKPADVSIAEETAGRLEEK